MDQQEDPDDKLNYLDLLLILFFAVPSVVGIIFFSGSSFARTDLCGAVPTLSPMCCPSLEKPANSSDYEPLFDAECENVRWEPNYDTSNGDANLAPTDCEVDWFYFNPYSDGLITASIYFNVLRCFLQCCCLTLLQDCSICALSVPVSQRDRACRMSH